MDLCLFEGMVVGDGVFRVDDIVDYSSESGEDGGFTKHNLGYDPEADFFKYNDDGTNVHLVIPEFAKGIDVYPSFLEDGLRQNLVFVNRDMTVCLARISLQKEFEDVNNVLRIPYKSGIDSPGALTKTFFDQVGKREAVLVFYGKKAVGVLMPVCGMSP